MMILSGIANPLAQIFLLIVMGYVMRRKDIPGAAFWPSMERVTYFILFPALLIHSIANTDISGLNPAPILLTALPSVGLITLLLLGLRPWLGIDGPAFTSVYQGAVRYNSYVGLGLVAGLYGKAGISLYAIIMAATIPVINLLCVSLLARYALDGQRPSWIGQIKLIAQNPLIIACLLGVILNQTGIGLPGPLNGFMDALGKASLALGLLAVGAGLELRRLVIKDIAIPLSITIKFLLLPLCVAGFAWLNDLGGQERAMLILWSSLPTAATAYVLARQLGGDAPLMAAIVSIETVLAFAAIPILMALLA